MNALLVSPASYIIPSLYLLSLTLLSKKYTPPIFIHGLVAITGLSLNIIFNGLGAGLRSLGLAFTIFLFLVFTGILSKSGTFVLPVSLVALPVLSWIAFFPGIFLLGLVSLWKIRKVTSNAYLASIAVDTLDAIGVLDALNGKVSKPNIDLLPIPGNSEDDVSEKTKKAKSIKVNLNLYLGVSIMMVGLIAYYKNLN